MLIDYVLGLYKYSNFSHWLRHGRKTHSSVLVQLKKPPERFMSIAAENWPTLTDMDMDASQMNTNRHTYVVKVTISIRLRNLNPKWSVIVLITLDSNYVVHGWLRFLQLSLLVGHTNLSDCGCLHCCLKLNRHSFQLSGVMNLLTSVARMVCLICMRDE